MKRLLVGFGFLLAAYAAVGQIYTGGKGDGATMSCVPPQVTTLTPTQMNCVGDTVVMAVYATGTNLQYKWQKMGANFFMDLANNANDPAVKYVGLGTDTLRICNPTASADSGLYRCLVVNTCDSDTSETFHLDLNRAPWLSSRMANYEQMSYACVNTGHRDLIPSILSERNDVKYTWRRIDTLTKVEYVLKDTTMNLRVDLTPPAKNAEGRYIVTAYNECGEVSDSVFLPVYDIPRISWITNTVNGVISACKYEDVLVQAQITGGGTYSMFELLRLSVSRNDWENADLVQQGFPTLDASAVLRGVTKNVDAGKYRWSARNECSTEKSYSDVIELRVGDVPSFATNYPEAVIPEDQTVCESGRLEMMARAHGDGIRYHWTHNGVDIPGADSNVLIIDTVKLEDAGTYHCIAVNECIKHGTTPAIFVTVDPLPVFERDPYLAKRACEGDSIVRFHVKMNSTIPYDSIRWFYKGQPIMASDHYENPTTEDFNIIHVGVADVGGHYTVKAYNKCGVKQSDYVRMEQLAIRVRLNNGPDDGGMLLCAGMEQKMTVSAVGTRPIRFRWILNEHVYETEGGAGQTGDTTVSAVTVQGNDIVDKNKYTIYAYNECNEVMDTGWIHVEVIEHFKLECDGLCAEYCEGHDPNGELVLQNSADSLTYSLFRNHGRVYGEFVSKLDGTGSALHFHDLPGGTYYVMATNPKTECSQEMKGRPSVTELPAPRKPNLFVSKFNCFGTGGATIVMDEWENNVYYELQVNKGKGFEPRVEMSFTGGDKHWNIPEMRSPDPGQPRIYENMGNGRYRIVASDLDNGCTTTVTLEDSIRTLEPPSIHKLKAHNNDTVNCNRNIILDGVLTPWSEYTSLEVDRFMKGARYTLYKDGVVDPDHEPVRSEPVTFDHIHGGLYQVEVETREGCIGHTNVVRVHDVDAPTEQPMSLSGSPCAELDTDGDTKTLTFNSTEAGITYELYRRDPFTMWDSFIGDGGPRSFTIPNQKATFYAVAKNEMVGRCTTQFTNELMVHPSDFTISANPSTIFLDQKGLRTWLHFDIEGDVVYPLTVQWNDENQLEQNGRWISMPNNAQMHKQYSWPFCPCAGKHDCWGGISHTHNASCTPTTCPLMYHNWKPDGYTYVTSEYGTYTDCWGRVRYGKMYDLYYNRDAVTDDYEKQWFTDDVTNPLRNRLTTPVNEDRNYTVTMTDAAGCAHTTDISVNVIGGRLRANILYSRTYRHYYYPFCEEFHTHHHHYYYWWWNHHCDANCTPDNCYVMYHNMNFGGCILREHKYIDYKGVRNTNWYDVYYCCTDIRARDTFAYKNDELFFCSKAKGGDYTYDVRWSFKPDDGDEGGFSGRRGDSIVFPALVDGELYLNVTSMGQAVVDSIHIDVWRRPFVAYIQNSGGDDRIDSLYICKGEETKLYAYHSGGDSPITTFQWNDGEFDGPNTEFWIFTPDRSKWVYLTARNDDVTVRDSVYILVREAPDVPVVEDPGVRCVQPRQPETILVKAPTNVGVNYVLEYSMDNGQTYVEMDRLNNSNGGPISFRVDYPVRDAGVYRVKAEGTKGDHECSTYSEMIEFIAPPSHDAIVSTKYCKGETYVLQLQSKNPEADMSYSVSTNRGVVLETIKSPSNYFSTQVLGEGDYTITYTRNGHWPFEDGLTQSCSESEDFHIERVVEPNIVHVVVNGGNRASCEGSQADTLSMDPTEMDVKYLLKAPDGVETDLFMGNGGLNSVVKNGLAYGTYEVIAEREGCQTTMDWFVVNRNPKPVVQNDVAFCYDKAKGIALSDGVRLEYSRLEPDVKYILKIGGVKRDSLVGGGETLSFEHVLPLDEYGKVDTNMTIVAINESTGCSSMTEFHVIPNPEPTRNYTLERDCGKSKAKMLEIFNASEPDVEYTLYRDRTAVMTKRGDNTGEPLVFGDFNQSGVYTAKARNVNTGCAIDVPGEVVIYELNMDCKLYSSNPVCVADQPTTLTFPCTSIGWRYSLTEIPDVDPQTWRTTPSVDGDGTAVTWDYIWSKKIGSRIDSVWNPRLRRYLTKEVWPTYRLSATDGCDTIAELATFEIKKPKKPESILLPPSRDNSTPYVACPNEKIALYVDTLEPGIKYTLNAIMTGGERYMLDTFSVKVGKADSLLGLFKARMGYALEMVTPEGCAYTSEITIRFRPMPEATDIHGESVCSGEGVLTVEVDTVPFYNYLLYRYDKDGNAYLKDRIDFDDHNRRVFNDQTEKGVYVVVTQNVTASGGVLCSDTISRRFSINESPEPGYVLAAQTQSDKYDIYLCDEAEGVIEVKPTEKWVDYYIYKDGVRCVRPDDERDVGDIEFRVHEEGVYTVYGYYDGCETKMLDSVVVHQDYTPDILFYDTVKYCRGEEGAHIRVDDAPYGCILTLIVNGKPMETHTVEHYYGDGISDTIIFDYVCTSNPMTRYEVMYHTLGGCEGTHEFTVIQVNPPDPLEAFSTGDDVCEGDCTEVGMKGLQKQVEYELYQVRPESEGGDAIFGYNWISPSYQDTQDTTMFEYPICERGDFYIVARLYNRPFCETRIKINGEDMLHLQEVDTVKELSFADYEPHYCAGRSTGATITLLDAEVGVQYRLVKDGEDPYHVGPNMFRFASTKGETLEWDEVQADEECEGNYLFNGGTKYRVMAISDKSRCAKWMDAPVTVVADLRPVVDALTPPHYEFCEGDSLNLKVRAAGCGMSYKWMYAKSKRDNAPTEVGYEPDLHDLAQRGQYWCEISNTCGLVESQPKIDVTVKKLVYNPMLNKPDVEVCEDEPALIYTDLQNVADGDYRWHRLGDDGHILSSHPFVSFDTIKKADEGYYVCVGGDLSKGYCNVVCDTQYIRVNPNINKVNIQVEYDTVCSGTDFGFFMSIPGFKTEWYYNGDLVVEALNMQGFDKKLYVKDEGVYAVKVTSNGCKEVPPIPVYDIVVDTTLKDTWHTPDYNLCVAGPVLLDMTVYPSRGVKYMWQEIISGEEPRTLGTEKQMVGIVPEGVGHVTYRGFYRNECNKAEVAQYVDVDVTVDIAAEATTPWPKEITACEGDATFDQSVLTLRMSMAGTDETNYIWVFTAADSTHSDTIKADNGSPTHTIPFERKYSGLYTGHVETSCGWIRYPYSTWVRINTKPNIEEDLNDDKSKMCSGGVFEPFVTATGSDLQFRWVLKSKNGFVDTIQKSMGYSWTSTDKLHLNTDPSYSGDTLVCVVYNGCDVEESAPIVLSIEDQKTIKVDPEFWVCYAEKAEVPLKMEYVSNGTPFVNGNWSYDVYKANEPSYVYRHIDVPQAKAGLDTLFDMRPGTYYIQNVVTSTCTYKDTLAEFTVKELPQAEGEMSLEGGVKKDTLCDGDAFPLYIKVKGGTGPFYVSVYESADPNANDEDWTLYNGMLGDNPFFLTAKQAHDGYLFKDQGGVRIAQSLLTKTVNGTTSKRDVAYFKVKVEDSNAERYRQGQGCQVDMSGVDPIKIKVVPHKTIDFNESRNLMQNRYIIGICQTPYNLQDNLNPSYGSDGNTAATGGYYTVRKLGTDGHRDTTYIVRESSPYLMEEFGEGKYVIGYKLEGGVCGDSVRNPRNITVYPRPTAEFIPTDSVLCRDDQLVMRTITFKTSDMVSQYRIESRIEYKDFTVDDYGTSGSIVAGEAIGGNYWDGVPHLRKVELPYGMNIANVSLRATQVKDYYGCTPENVKTGVYTYADNPSLSVQGLKHSAVSGNYWENEGANFSISQGDSVEFRLSLTGGPTPWHLQVQWDSVHFAMQDCVFTDIIVTNPDTTLFIKKQGYYRFFAEDAYGCMNQEYPKPVTTVLVSPDGYLRIENLLLGGALDPDLRKSAAPSQFDLFDMLGKKKMKSGLKAQLPDWWLPGCKPGNSVLESCIDWVFVEARDPVSDQFVSRDTVMLLSHGAVLNRDGQHLCARLPKTGASGTSYNIYVFHRNHLPIRSARAVGLDSEISTYTTLTFGFKSNFYVPAGSTLVNHAMMVGNDDEFYAMAPAYKKVTDDLLVSISNPNAFFDKGDASVVYSEFDVNLDGRVDISSVSFISNKDWSKIMDGASKDEQQLLLSRDKLPIVEDWCK